MRFEHGEAMGDAHKHTAALTAEKDALAAKRNQDNAHAKAVIGRLQAEADALEQTNSNLERQLNEMAKGFKHETGRMRSEWTQQVSRLSQTAEQQRKELNHEVQRLRTVQEDVLAQKGASTLTGEARRLLFYESMKAKSTQPLRPNDSMTWRGQEQPMPRPTSPAALVARLEQLKAEVDTTS